MRARITVESGDCHPKSVELYPGLTVTIGRSRENVFVVKDDLVSRLHLKVFFEDGKWLIRDFGLNGTRVGTERLVGASELLDGTKFVVGQVTFVYQALKSTQIPVEAIHKPEQTELIAAKAVSQTSRIDASSAERAATHVVQYGKQTTREPYAAHSTVHDLEPDGLMRADELTTLCRYMTSTVMQSDPQEIIRQAIRTILNQTASAVVGYLSLDANEPIPKMTVPERTPMDMNLSKRLTERVRQTKARVWVFNDMLKDMQKSGSLSSFNDAVCIPIGGVGDEPVAALHAYRHGRSFSERDVRFIESVAGFLAPVFELHRYRRKLEAENSRLRTATANTDELIGDSTAMMNLRMQIGRAAPLPFTVLIYGESGTGKELVALALHKHSPRVNGPLIAVNCASIPANLLEAELFGYRKGAFPGADHDRVGLLEQADEGTLFLDEIADLSLECQAKLLRVIEGKSFRPIGSNREIHVDVRVVTATTHDLEQEVREGRFRQELLFRLKVIAIKVPPLREHVEDIGELSRFFLEKLSQQLRRNLRLSPEAEHRMFCHSWPGNIRQLRAVLESAAVMTDGDVIDVDVLPIPAVPEDAPMPGTTSSLNEVPSSMDMDNLETWAIMRALKHTAGNVSQAARVLGISRDTLHTKLKKKNIDREQLLSPPETVTS